MFDSKLFFTEARDALQAEDVALAKAFRAARDRNPRSYDNVAHGITYWLYETTLVYSIFKSLAPRLPLSWEHAAAAEPLRPVCTEAKAYRGACDLVVFHDWDRHHIAAAIEAKWWNDASRKTRNLILNDKHKLQRNYGDPIERYIMTFWWGKADNWDEDLRDARSFCDEQGMILVDVEPDRMKFETSILIGGARTAGYFAVAGIQV